MQVLNGLYESAVAAKGDPVVGKQATDVIGGIASCVAVLKVMHLTEMIECISLI